MECVGVISVWIIIIEVVGMSQDSGNPIDGAANGEVNARILGGTRVKLGEFPFIVSLQSALEKRHFCTGSLLSDRHVLTACHCLILRGISVKPRLKYPQSTLVMAGAVDLRDPKATRHKVISTFIHPRCARKITGLIYDVGALLTDPFELKHGVIDVIPRSNYYFNLYGLMNQRDPPIALESYTAATRVSCTTAGWGATQESGSSSAVLLKVVLEMMPQRDCLHLIDKYAVNVAEDLRFDNRSQFCTLGAGGRDACSGDSGGPLLCHLPRIRGTMLAAVTSWGIGCGREGVPGSWARVDKVEKWIVQKILTKCQGVGVAHRLILSIPVALGAKIDFDEYGNDNKITGGERADWGEYPYVVSLQAPDTHVCGGSLILSSVVLTACHCISENPGNTGGTIVPRDPASYTVVAGVVDLGKRLASSYRRKQVQSVKPHPKCEKPVTGWNWDVGLVQIAGSFPMIENKISTVDLPFFPDFPQDIVRTFTDEELRCDAVGWGLTSERAKKSSLELLKVNLQLMPLEECEEKIRKYASSIGSNLRFIPEAQVCTMGQKGKDACKGDSGGPLLCDTSRFTNSRRQTFFATVSWGIGCGRSGVPGGWARLDVTYKWINETADIYQRTASQPPNGISTSSVLLIAVIALTIKNAVT